MGFYYAVRIGRTPGVYTNWDSCKAEIQGFSGAIYKKFKTREEAEAFARAAGTSYDVKPKSDANVAGRHGLDESISTGASKSTKASASNSRKLKSKSGDGAVDGEGAGSVEFDTDVIAYVDGSFNIATSVFGYGAILLFPDGRKLTFQGSGSDPSLASMRNVSGEIHGSMRAVSEALKLGCTSIAIYYDYMGIACWAEGTWKTNKEGTKNYKDFMQKAKQQIDIRFCKVKAHTGVEYNEEADKLAKAAVGIL